LAEKSKHHLEIANKRKSPANIEFAGQNKRRAIEH
jgi:hypothetical protein